MPATSAPGRLTPHAGYLQLGSDAQSRCDAYRVQFDGMIPDAELTAIRMHVQQQRAWGSERFRAQIEALTGRAAGVRPRGRPWPDKERDGK